MAWRVTTSFIGAEAIEGRRSGGRLVGGIDVSHFGSGRGEDGAGRHLNEGEIEEPMW
jgi:hypothetical protein